MRGRTLMTTMVLATITVASGGCYDNTGAAPPPAAPTPAPVEKQGPLTSFGQQPASSALGKAKRTAGNIADQAEQKSREVADQADDMMNPKPRPNDPPPSDDGTGG